MPEEDLQRVFQNLIQNALQYRKAEITPRIDITAQRNGNESIFSVQDNGIGIPVDYTQQIFGIFKRLHGAGQYGSTGMGLAICQEILERHRGRIWVKSQLGVGSIFHFSLPTLAIEMIPGQDATSDHVAFY